MENFNTIPSAGTYGSAIALINANFSLTKEQLERLSYSREGFCGMYDTPISLNAAYPNPTTGSFAYVGTSFPMDVYTATNGVWAKTIEDGYSGGEIDLSQYADKASLTALASRVTALENAGYMFIGIATPAGAPSPSQAKRFALAWAAGTYTYYGGFVLNSGEMAVLTYNGSTWSGTKTDIIAKGVVGGYDTTPTEDSEKPITSGGVYTAMDELRSDMEDKLSNVDMEFGSGEYVSDVIIHNSVAQNESALLTQGGITSFVFNEIDLNDIDNLNNIDYAYSPSQSQSKKTSYYTVVTFRGTSTTQKVKVGTMVVISDGLAHMVTEVMTTRYVLDASGNLTGEISNNDVFTIYRSTSGNAWTQWHYVNESAWKEAISGIRADLTNYYTKSQAYSKTEVDNLIAAINQFEYIVTNTLPAPSANTMLKIYLIPAAQSATQNIKDEYITIWDGNIYKWEQIGSTAIDLSNYSTTTEMNTAINAAIASALISYYTKTDVNALLNDKQDVIGDLPAIRSGAAAGATAVQPAAMNSAISNAVSAESARIRASIGYYECSTSAATAAKVVSASGYTLTNGGCIRIKMTNANTADNVTLNINSTGAKALYYDGSQASTVNTWKAGEVLEVYYDGTQYQCASGGGGGKFATGQKVADTSISSEFANNDALLRGMDAYPELYEQVINGTISVAENYTFTGSKYINSSGKEASGASSWMMTTDFIEIASNWLSVTIGATGGATSGLAVAFYSAASENSFISGSPCTVQTTVLIPSNAKYVRFCKANTNDVHTINLFVWNSKLNILDNKIAAVKTELESEYVQIQQEVDFLPTLISGKAYKSNGIGTVIASSNNASFKYAKIACKKGDIFAINGFGGNANAWPCIVTDANDIVLFGQTSAHLVGGVYQVTQNSAAWLYVSVYNATPSALKKLAVSADGTLVIPPEYANVGCMETTGAPGIYSGVVGFGIPLALRPGDVVKIKFNSFNNYRGYLLKDENMAFIGYISDSSLNADTLFSWNGSGIAYLYVNGNNSWWQPQVTRYARETVVAMKNYGKRMVALGDSITSYDASDIGELVRGHIGMAFCRTATQIDWGNIAEGLATICNWPDTTKDFTHSGANHNRTLPNEVLKLLQHTTAEGAQITWHINSNNTDYSIDTTVATGTGYTDDKPDLIYISMGTNDSVTTDDFSEVIAQSYGALTKLTICSSLRWCLETLQNVYPDATIVCVIPIKRGTRTVAEQEAKNELIRKMCNYMAIPVVDGYNISGYSPLSYGIYSTDQIHPNNHTQRIARSIAAQVDALI